MRHGHVEAAVTKSQHIRTTRVTRADLDAAVFGAAVLLLALHPLDLALWHQSGSAVVRGALLIGAVLLVTVAWPMFVTRGRFTRALLAAAFGVAAIVVALSVAVPHVALVGAGGSDYSGVLLGVGGAVLVVLGFRVSLRGRPRALQVASGIATAFVIAQWLVAPAINAGLATTAPVRSAVSAHTLGIPGARDVSFRARDGVPLAGWYVPSRNGATVLLLHGSHGSRMDTLAHLRMLTGLGYGVLAYDARGHGRSAGQTNALGWRGTDDIPGAISFLERQPGVDRHRIAALGLSMGAEEALRAAASGVPLRAVIADGAGASTLGDSELTEPALGPVFVSVTWLTMRGVEVLSGEREPESLEAAVASIRVPTLLIASGRSGERTIDSAYRDRIGVRASLWLVPDAGHTKALERHPQAYTERVTAFLANALRLNSHSSKAR
ncbi:MAG TPA: alpha/beta hydrolase [Solirubrobacteraceae bacterium]|nr:alpha/beta hydrolase [Solirubrobacteraceae bacterium]